MSKKPVVFPKIGEGFDDLFDTLANTPTPTEHIPKKKLDKSAKGSKTKGALNKKGDTNQ